MNAQDYDDLPPQAKAIINSYNEEKNIYAECLRISVELQKIGYSCEYGLDGIYTVFKLN